MLADSRLRLPSAAVCEVGMVGMVGIVGGVGARLVPDPLFCLLSMWSEQQGRPVRADPVAIEGAPRTLPTKPTIPTFCTCPPRSHQHLHLLPRVQRIRVQLIVARAAVHRVGP